MSTGKALEILQHALGVDEFGQGRQYRCSFVTGEGSDDYPTCRELVERGLMTRRPPSQISGGDDIFLVTATGRQFVADNSPAPPLLTRAQKRYQAWLDEDCNMRFGDWLRSSPRP